MNRFEVGEKVIVKVRAHGMRTGDRRDVDQFFAATVTDANAPDAGYRCTYTPVYIDALDGDIVQDWYFTFYDVAPLSKSKLEDLRWEGFQAQRAIDRISEWWQWGKPDAVASTKET